MRLLIILFCCFQFNSIAQKVFVLFVGNSLTYFSDTPGKLKKMLQMTGDSVIIEQCTAPGFRLWLCFDAVYGGGMLKCIENKLLTRKWDYIIIQNPNDGFLNPKQEMKNVIQRFDSMAVKNGARLMISMPYLNEDFPKYYCSRNDRHEVNCSSLYKSTRQALDSINIVVAQTQLTKPLIQAQIGEAYYQYETQYSIEELNTNDYHPTELGAYFHACCYYYVITGSTYTNIASTDKQKTIEQFIKKLFTTKNKR